MIKYNSNTINDWYYNSSDIIKVYHNGAVCYYKLDSSSPSGQTPCFAVVDDITQYTETEFEDVYDKATEKWYKLNNLNEYEEYGVYGSGRTSCGAVSFTELTDIIAQSTTALTNHNITVTPAVGAFSKIRIDTTKSATTSSYCWVTFTPTPSGSEVLGINMSSIGAMNGYGNNKNYVTDANGSQTFAHWVDDNNTIVEIDIAALSNNQTSELYLLFYQENCNPAAFSFYIEQTDCVTTYEGKLTIDEEATSRLPQGYTEVEYIQNNTQGAYINTGLLLYDVTGNSFSISAKLKSQYESTWAGDGYYLQTIINSEDVSSPYYGFTFRYAYRTHVLEGACNPSNSVVFSSIANTDGTSSLTINCNSTTVTSQVPLELFASYNGNYNTPYRFSNATIYSFQVTKNDTLVRDLVPAKRDSDDKYGLYDIVNDVFYLSPNNVDFSGGEPVIEPTKTYEYEWNGTDWVNVGEVSGSSRLPVGYTEVEYITAENLASGITGPYIDTNFTPNQNTRVVLDYQAIVNGQNNRRIFGSGRFNNTSSGNYIWSMENRIGQSNCYYYYKFDNGSSWKTSTLHPDLNRHVVDFNKEGKIWLDDTAVITLPSTSFTCSYNLGLFNEINSGAQTLYEYFQGRVYSCQVYDNGTMVRDLVPCKNSSDVAGMYDLVNDVFYTTANQSYQFEAGSSVAPPIVLPINYDEKAEPPNNLTFSSMTEAEEYECPWVGMNATIDGSRYIFSGDSTSGYEWVEIISPIPSEYTELEYCVVPRVKPTTLFTVPYECQPNYKYTTEFTPLNFWSTSYYGGIAGYNDSNNKDFEYLIFKLDNGWGDQFNRFMIKFQNYEWDTRRSGTVPRAFTFYENVRAKITLHLNNYSAGQGAVLTIENEGYTTYSNTRTQVIDSSWQITYGVKDLNLLNDNSTNDFCANMNFHNFKVEDTQGNLIYDYRPVTRLSDNKVGLYDVVNQQFFYPTGFTLTAGPSV